MYLFYNRDCQLGTSYNIVYSPCTAHTDCTRSVVLYSYSYCIKTYCTRSVMLCSYAYGIKYMLENPDTEIFCLRFTDNTPRLARLLLVSALVSLVTGLTSNERRACSRNGLTAVYGKTSVNTSNVFNNTAVCVCVYVSTANGKTSVNASRDVNNINECCNAAFSAGRNARLFFNTILNVHSLFYNLDLYNDQYCYN